MGIWDAVGGALEGLKALGAVGFAAVKGAVHGVVGGALSLAQGGSFAQGFAANAIGAVAGVFSEGAFGAASTGGFESMMARTAVAAASGCAGAVIAHGSCANGAVTAAFANLYNKWGDLPPAPPGYDAKT